MIKYDQKVNQKRLVYWPESEEDHRFVRKVLVEALPKINFGERKEPVPIQDSPLFRLDYLGVNPSEVEKVLSEHADFAPLCA